MSRWSDYFRHLNAMNRIAERGFDEDDCVAAFRGVMQGAIQAQRGPAVPENDWQQGVYSDTWLNRERFVRECIREHVRTPPRGGGDDDDASTRRFRLLELDGARRRR